MLVALVVFSPDALPVKEAVLWVQSDCKWVMVSANMRLPFYRLLDGKISSPLDAQTTRVVELDPVTGSDGSGRGNAVLVVSSTTDLSAQWWRIVLTGLDKVPCEIMVTEMISGAQVAASRV